MKQWNLRKLAVLLLALSMLPSFPVLPTTAAGSVACLTADVTYPVKGGALSFNPNTGMITSCSEYVTVVEIPSEIDGIPVTGIGEDAFANTYQLKRLTIPDSVIIIENFAFDECYYLSSVVYTGTQDQWFEIYIGYGNNALTESNITFSGSDASDPYQGEGEVDPYSNFDETDPYADGGNETDPYAGNDGLDPYVSGDDGASPNGGNDAADPYADGDDGTDPYAGNDGLDPTTDGDEDVPFSDGDTPTSGPAGPNPFTDVKVDDYFYDAVQWAYRSNPQITNGIDDTHFSPDSTVTRGQCVTFLWRSQGCPEPASARSPFTDVLSGQYYYKAVLWAVEQGITNGTDANHFSPNLTLSTAHITTFLYRTLGLGSDGWYQDAANWATRQNLLLGMNLMVSPSVKCPRGAVVTLLYRQLGKA